MGSFTDFIRGGGENPRRKPELRGEQIRMTYCKEGVAGYERVGILKGAATRVPTIRDRDVIECVLGMVAAAFGIPKEEVLQAADVWILLSVKTSDGEIVARRKEPRGKCA